MSKQTEMEKGFEAMIRRHDAWLNDQASKYQLGSIRIHSKQAGSSRLHAVKNRKLLAYVLVYGIASLLFVFLHLAWMENRPGNKSGPPPLIELFPGSATPGIVQAWGEVGK